MDEFKVENSSLDEIKNEYPNKLKVLCTGSNLNVAENEKFNLLSFMSKNKTFSGDIIIQTEASIASGVLIVFPNNDEYKSLIQRYQNNQRYYLQQEGKSIQDKVKII